VVRDRTGARTLFEYRNWIGYQPATLVAFARLLRLDVSYFHNQDAEFVPVEERTETSDCREENTFLLFRR
jgi:hypothetical protein